MPDLRCAICDVRFGIYDLRDGGANSPSVAEGVPEGRGSNIEVRFTIEDLARWQAFRSAGLGRRPANRTSHIRGFRSTLARFAEWCPRKRGEKRGRWAAGWDVPLPEPFPSPPISPCSLRRAAPFRCERSEQAEPPAYSGGPHHSAKFCSQNFAEPPTTPYHAPAKKNGPREFPGTVGFCDLRLATYDLRMYHRPETIDHRPFSKIVNRTSQIGISSSPLSSSPRPSRSSRARSRCPWRNRSGRGWRCGRSHSLCSEAYRRHHTPPHSPFSIPHSQFE